MLVHSVSNQYHTPWDIVFCGAMSNCSNKQGGIDGSENPRDAAVRELREETGVTSAEVIAEV